MSVCLCARQGEEKGRERARERARIYVPGADGAPASGAPHLPQNLPPAMALVPQLEQNTITSTHLSATEREGPNEGKSERGRGGERAREGERGRDREREGERGREGRGERGARAKMSAWGIHPPPTAHLRIPPSVPRGQTAGQTKFVGIEPISVTFFFLKKIFE